jgi:hypothetical protein
MPKGSREIKQPDFYHLGNRRLTLFPYEIENYIQSNLNIDIMFLSYSNSKFNLIYNVFTNMTFENARKLKKFLMDNLPLVVSVTFDVGTVEIIFTRKYGYDILDTKP